MYGTTGPSARFDGRRLQRRLHRRLGHIQHHLAHAHARRHGVGHDHDDGRHRSFGHDHEGDELHDHDEEDLMYDHDAFHAQFAPHGRGGHHGGRHGGRHRARRGAIVDAVLLLLDERPMHGYELITELEARSEGRWRPSPGTMYPALNRMEEKGLIDAEEVDGKKRFSLSDGGRTRLDEYLAERDEDAPAPWNEHASGGRGDLRRRVSEIVGQARQIGRFGTSEQITAALEVFDDTRRRLYAILAETDRS